MELGLLGQKLSHSYSPQIFSLLGNDSYHLYEVEPPDLGNWLQESSFDGLNVTIPYKNAVIPYLDGLDELAARLESVNTIVRDSKGRLIGHNSDYYGFSYLLAQSGMDIRGKKALILGSGGAASTVQAVLADGGAKTVIISRRGKNNYQNLQKHKDACIIVNTTPVGMYPDNGNSPVDINSFDQPQLVLDLIYNPARTALLLDCEKAGIPAYNGLMMLVAQAKGSAEWFWNRNLDDDIIPKILKQLQRKMENLVLIGMAGCGKSTIAAALAKKTGRKFIDADMQTIKLAGMSIEEIFAQKGEKGFRQLETAVLRELGKSSGKIIATGGGCVTQKENYDLLHQNGKIVLIKRNTADLPVSGRPLSQARGAAALYEQRKPLYEAFADFTIENNGTAAEAAEAILKIWEG